MTISLDITPDLEKQLRVEATRAGLEPQSFIVDTLRERLRATHLPPHLPRVESELLHKINLGLSEANWKRYRVLLGKRDAETLTPDEHAELIAISDEIEMANARRIEALVQLARLRGTTLTGLMKALGLQAPPYA